MVLSDCGSRELKGTSRFTWIVIDADLENPVALVQIGDCVFDEAQHKLSHGFESLDFVAQEEAFVNHVHLVGSDAIPQSDEIIGSWTAEMRVRWAGRVFRIYRQVEPDEVTVRFHQVHAGIPNWCEQGVEVITVAG